MGLVISSPEFPTYKYGCLYIHNYISRDRVSKISQKMLKKSCISVKKTAVLRSLAISLSPLFANVPHRDLVRIN